MTVSDDQTERRVIRGGKVRSANLVPEGEGTGYIVCKDEDIDETMLSSLFSKFPHMAYDNAHNHNFLCYCDRIKDHNLNEMSETELEKSVIVPKPKHQALLKTPRHRKED